MCLLNSYGMCFKQLQVCAYKTATGMCYKTATGMCLLNS